MGIEIVRATPADRDTVIDTVVAAFAGDPAFRYFFPDDATYPAHAGAFVGHLFDRRVRSGTVWLTEGAVAMWEEPGATEGVPGPGLPADVLERLERYDAAVHRIMPKDPYWYLGILATHPAHAGRRLGRRLLAAGVTTAHADGLPAVLETVSPSNVDLYRREGWEVLAGTDEGGPMTWVLVNQPAAAHGRYPEERGR